MRILLIAVTFFIAGCASSSNTYLADGRQGYNLNCSGTARNWGMCIEKAGAICKDRGYDVVSYQGEGGAALFAGATQTNASVIASSLHFRTMQIACKR